MKIVLFLDKSNKNEVKRTINHFLAYGYDDMILFTKKSENSLEREELKYYLTNGIKITAINALENESTSQRLLFIKGSLNNSFLVVYSSSITSCDIDNLLDIHKNDGNLATTLVFEGRMVACVLENEIFDYPLDEYNFEKEILKRVGQDLELNQVMV